MQKKRIGLAENWDGPKRRFAYLFTPCDNDSLEIIELEHEREFNEDLPRSLDLHECPPEVAAEINISMGAIGMAVSAGPGRRLQARFWRWRKRLRLRWIKLTRKPA